MHLIDTHAHLTHPDLFSQIDHVLARAKAAGVINIISIASGANDAEQALAVARTEAMVRASAGIHPHEAGKIALGDIDRVARLWSDPKVVAVGEIGLDYHYDFADRETQQRIFQTQLERAREADLPLIIHCREAFPDCIALLEQHGFRDRKVVFHCFTGTTAEAAQVAARNWRISFTGIVTFKNSSALQQIARDYPIDQLMLETDSPYLSPVPVRHKKPNEPVHVAHTAGFLATLRNEPVETLADRTTANARAFFRLLE